MNGVLIHEFENLAGSGIVSWMRMEDVKSGSNLSHRKEVEKESMNLLINEAMGAGFTMKRDDFGKPWQVNKKGFISLSHSVNWVAFCFHPNQPMGIDVETTRFQLQKVAPRILHQSELSIMPQKERLECLQIILDSLQIRYQYQLHSETKLLQ